MFAISAPITSLGLAVTTLRFTLIIDLGGDQHYRNEIEHDLSWGQLHALGVKT
jgi:hypothetical protein